jgi:ribosome-binding protein aMBF1 (putative translation factor)
VTCERCGETVHPPTYRVTSDILSMMVCYSCALAARYLERYKGTGELSVKEVTEVDK